jgi:hypothetical protein
MEDRWKMRSASGIFRMEFVGVAPADRAREI